MSIESMSLKEMKQYQGINPKPEDFDRFWDKGLSKVEEWEPNPSFKQSDFRARGAECYDLYFHGIDGAAIYAKYLKPADISGKLPVIFMFHGYTVNSGDWSDKLVWVQQGFAVVALDCRGQAGKSNDIGNVTGTTYLGHIIRGLLDEPEQLLYRMIFLDTAVLVKIIRNLPEIDENRMVTYGQSQGGALALVCAALVPDIKRSAVLYPFLSDYQRAWELNCANSAYEELRHFFRSHDPRHEREAEFFNKLGYIDIQHLVPRIKAEIVWGIGLKDETCPASTQFAAYNHITSEKKMLFYPDFAHEFIPGFQDESFRFMSDLIENTGF